jgi:hypothetical protein
MSQSSSASPSSLPTTESSPRIDKVEALGFSTSGKAPAAADQQRMQEYVNLKLAARGLPIVGDPGDYPFLEMGRSLIKNFQERLRLLSDHLCPVDQHVSDFLRDYLGDDAEGVFEKDDPVLPSGALVLERHGIARLLSLPARGDRFQSNIVSSFRTAQGVCHNPASDRRTTAGVFHVSEGGLPVPGDKLAVPKGVFGRLLKAALTPPPELMVLPYTSDEPEPVRAWASLLLRPTVCPEVPGFTGRKSNEVRFFAPGNLVSNLDFVESIFGNAGDPYLPENDARLDVERWTGHSGCVILAPHLVGQKKKDLGLPHVDEATDRQKRDGMCWESEDELYNGGSAFKITARDRCGVMVTVIADNYFGYCKKEVKTQISYAANLYGLVEEEHAGGALVFPSFDLGESFALSQFHSTVDHTFAGVADRYGSLIDVRPEGYGIDRRFANIIYLPEDARVEVNRLSIRWQKDGTEQKLPLLTERTYVMPSGYKLHLGQPSAGQRWRLIGTQAEATFCHKPCTVSGGGKSEISKSLSDAMEAGPVVMPNFQADLEEVEKLLARDYSDRYWEEQAPEDARPSRAILDPARSLGSVIRLFSPSEKFTKEYNQFITEIPRSVKDFIFILKRFYKPSWGDNWRGRFRVDSINGQPAVELKYRDSLVITRYLRVGYSEDGSWRMFGLRKDFQPAVKLQREDDISASITVPESAIDRAFLHPDVSRPAYKFVENCEYRLFQRPDDAVIRGYDKQTEIDFSRHDNFFSNYEPMTRGEARDMLDDAIRFNQFTKPMRRTIQRFAKAKEPDYFISSAHPRITGRNEETGKPIRTKNPRYLQTRPDLLDERGEYLAEMGARLFRRIGPGQPVLNPVNAVLPGRRNNPPDHEAGIPPLAVYGPIHYQELPELFMDYVASLTGRSPSTTGAGSEGALTKGPFNALPPVIDLNNALLSYIVAGYPAFSTAAGYIGPKYRVDHDISLVVPEVWSRMFIPEREPEHLIKKGFLEKVPDFEHGDRKVLGSRLGYRITETFVQTFFGRVFNEPGTVFNEEMLRPEKQNLDDYVAGIDNIVGTQKRVAQMYFEDGSIDDACPPLRAILHIMAHGDYEGKGADDPEVRAMFDRESVVSSDWYRARLEAKLGQKKAILARHVEALEKFLEKENYQSEADRLDVADRLQATRAKLDELHSKPEIYLKRIDGSLGVDPGLVEG